MLSEESLIDSVGDGGGFRGLFPGQEVAVEQLVGVVVVPHPFRVACPFPGGDGVFVYPGEMPHHPPRRVVHGPCE